jgi:AcrR family transcriptional regulator
MSAAEVRDLQSGKKRGRPSRRGEIVAATERLVRERGASAVTTRAIAQNVPCSEGAIYVHFKDRVDLLLAVLEESLPEMLVPLHALKAKVGEGTPEENLVTAVEGLRRFQERVVVMLCSLAGEPELRDRFQSALKEHGRGPQRGVGTLAEYINAEKLLGRIGLAVDDTTAAQMLMGSTFFQVFCAGVLGDELPLDVRRMVRMVIGLGLEAV